MPDDLLSITTLKTDDDDDGTYEQTWATTDYHLKPDNAALDGKPYRAIEVADTSQLSLPVAVQKGVEIVGSFGYSAGVSTLAPAAIKQACLLLANRLWRRKDTVFGTAGTAALSVTEVTSGIVGDADIMALLKTAYSRRGGMF